jgi:hypothetical protein
MSTKSTKKPRGFKKKLKDGRPVNVYLDQATKDKARKIGLGSVSEGIRIAVSLVNEIND